jgi:hypothetical protein
VSFEAPGVTSSDSGGVMPDTVAGWISDC